MTEKSRLVRPNLDDLPLSTSIENLELLEHFNQSGQGDYFSSHLNQNWGTT